MIKIDVRHNFPQVVDSLRQLQRDLADKVMARALNTTVQQAKPAMAKEITSEFRISSAEVKQRLKVNAARKRNGAYVLEASLEATQRNRGRGMGIIHFVETSTTLAQARKRAKSGTRDQVYFQIKRKGGKRYIDGAFIARNPKTGGTALFLRAPGTVMASRAKYAGTKHAEQIKVQTTIDVPQMFNTRRINAVVVRTMLERFGKNFDKELRAVLGGFVK